MENFKNLFIQLFHSGGKHEKKLLNELFDKESYNKLERPVENDSEPVQLSMSVNFQEINVVIL